MEKTRRMSPSMRHLRGVVRQEFAGLQSVEAVFIDQGHKPGYKGIRIWTILNKSGDTTRRDLQAGRDKVRQMRRDLKITLHIVPLRSAPKTPLLRLFRRTGALCAYLRKPERRAA